jgi:ribosome maturation factor RimP
MPGSEELTERVERLAEPLLEGMGIQLVEVEFRFEGRWILRLLIDRPQGVTLDDCAAASRALGPLLEEQDPVEQAYSLEVSSPGLFRPLSKPKHFRQAVGKVAKLHLAAGILPERKQRQIRGTLADAGDTGVVIDTGEERLELTFEAIRKAHLDPDL